MCQGGRREDTSTPGCPRLCPLPQPVELPDSFSPELRSLLEGLLQRDVNRRLGCMGRG